VDERAVQVDHDHFRGQRKNGLLIVHGIIESTPMQPQPDNWQLMHDTHKDVFRLAQHAAHIVMVWHR
jgi:hypothetical protein